MTEIEKINEIKAIVGAIMEEASKRYHGDLSCIECHVMRDGLCIFATCDGKKPHTLARWIERQLYERIAGASYGVDRDIRPLFEGDDRIWTMAVSCGYPYIKEDGEA